MCPKNNWGGRIVQVVRDLERLNLTSCSRHVSSELRPDCLGLYPDGSGKPSEMELVQSFSLSGSAA